MSASHDSALETISTGNALSNTRVPVTPGAMAKLRFADDANLSPDGQYIAFVVYEHRRDSEEHVLRWLKEYL